MLLVVYILSPDVLIYNKWNTACTGQTLGSITKMHLRMKYLLVDHVEEYGKSKGFLTSVLQRLFYDLTTRIS